MAPVEERLRTLERVTRDASPPLWLRLCAAEGWPVALVCYHIARGFERQATFIDGAMSGAGPHPYSWDDTHALNARIADEHPLPTPDEVLATAHAAIKRVRILVDTLSDADLARVAFVNGAFHGDVRWVVQNLMPQHADGHLASIASATAGDGGSGMPRP